MFGSPTYILTFCGGPLLRQEWKCVRSSSLDINRVGSWWHGGYLWALNFKHFQTTRWYPGDEVLRHLVWHLPSMSMSWLRPGIDLTWPLLSGDESNLAVQKLMNTNTIGRTCFLLKQSEELEVIYQVMKRATRCDVGGIHFSQVTKATSHMSHRFVTDLPCLRSKCWRRAQQSSRAVAETAKRRA